MEITVNGLAQADYLDTTLWLPRREEFTVTDPRVDHHRTLYRSLEEDRVFEYTIVYQNQVRFFLITKCCLLIEFISDSGHYLQLSQ